MHVKHTPLQGGGNTVIEKGYLSTKQMSCADTSCISICMNQVYMENEVCMDSDGWMHSGLGQQWQCKCSAQVTQHGRKGPIFRL